MKFILMITAAVVFSIVTRADTVIDITANQCDVCGFGTQPQVSFVAQVQTELITGTFFDAGEANLFSGTELEILSLSGNLNGTPISLAPAPFGQGSWLTQSFRLGTLYFSLNGAEGQLEEDNVQPLLVLPQGDVPVIYNTTVSTAEPETIENLALGSLILILVVIWRTKWLALSRI